MTTASTDRILANVAAARDKIAESGVPSDEPSKLKMAALLNLDTIELLALDVRALDLIESHLASIAASLRHG